MGRKWIVLFLTVWMLFALPTTVLAQGFDANGLGSISVTLTDRDGKTPIEGAELSVYYVADVSLNSENNLSYNFTDMFEACGCALDDPALSGKLETFTGENAVPVRKHSTDAYGNAAFTDLPLGLYFVKQTGTVEGYAPCTSFLVTVPSQTPEGYVYEVNASPKTDIARLTDITVQKIWNTDPSTEIADHVTVSLLRDGVAVKTATLREENNWQITYTDMPESDRYSVVEVDVPKGFTATYSQTGYVFTVTNSASLPQTGQLVWPIPILAMAGLCLIAVGVAVLRKAGNKNA